MTTQTMGLGRSLRWLVGFASLALAALALLITLDEPAPPPPARTIHDPAALSDAAGVPAVSYYKARDGTRLAYRAYPGGHAGVAVLLHGSARSSLAMHALAKALSDAGIAAFAPDVRGHGDSGVAGDIGFVGQLEDDLDEFVNYLRGTYPAAPIMLIGHSNGAGFALRVAGSPLGSRFAGCILLAPHLGNDAATTRPDARAWSDMAPFRIAGLTLLHRLGIDWFEQLPVVAFAIRPEARGRLGATYSYRLYANFRADEDYLGDFHRARIPIVVMAGEDDELMFTDRYAHALAAVGTPTRTILLPHVGHLGIVSDPAALAAVVEEYRRMRAAGRPASAS